MVQIVNQLIAVWWQPVIVTDVVTITDGLSFIVFIACFIFWCIFFLLGLLMTHMPTVKRAIGLFLCYVVKLIGACNGDVAFFQSRASFYSFILR